MLYVLFPDSGSRAQYTSGSYFPVVLLYVRTASCQCILTFLIWNVRNSLGSIHFSSVVVVHNMRAKSGLVHPFVLLLVTATYSKHAAFSEPKYLLVHCGQ